MVIIGSDGLENVDLIIPQGTTLYFTISHKDDQGNVVDHSDSIFEIVVETTDKQTTYNWSSYCEYDSDLIVVDIPAEATTTLPVGTYLWDLFVTMESGEVIRMVYGKVKIKDTYVPDGR